MSDQIVQPDDETREMLTSFCTETMDSLDAAEPLIDSVAGGTDEENINAIFRVFHTIKGVAGFFGLTRLSNLTHSAEALLDNIRKSKKPQSAEIIGLIYDNFDLIRTIIFSISRSFTDAEYEQEMKDMVVRLKSFLNRPEEQTETEEFTEDIFVLNREAEPEITAPEPVQAVTDNDDFIPAELFQRFVQDTLAALDNSEKLLIELETTQQKKEHINLIFGTIHSLKGNAGFMNLPEIGKLAMQAETILENMRSGDLEPNGGIVSFLLDIVDEVRTAVIKLSEAPPEVPSPFNKQAKEEAAQEKIVPLQSSAGVTPAKQTPTVQQSADVQKSGSQAIKRTDLRVDMAKLDSLFDLVGELITVETMISHNPDIEGLELPNFQKSASMLNKICRELQEITMSLRMTPLEALFNKMKRLVRDLSVKSGKAIEFVISGAETEMDKNVIEEIADPLVHILRNAVDHGLEMPDVRKERGKPEAGTVSLSAGYEGNEIVITIKDDGNGLNREKIIKKASERGLLKTTPDKLTDKEIYNFIFEAGFSTAEKLTEVSGRGVGMDVVRKNIEKLRGSIVVDSKAGKGSTFVLRIPLTLAILESMLVQVGDTKYAISILQIREALQPTSDMITVTMDGLELLNVRNEIFPVIRLHEFLGKEPKKYKLEEGIVIVVGSRYGKACLFVDEILGQQQAVIKGLTGYIGKVTGVTGCMVLSDGEVGLILDTDMILKESMNITDLVV